MSAYVFGGLNTSSTKKAFKSEAIENIVLIDEEKSNSLDPYFIILLDESYNGAKLRGIRKLLQLNRITNYKAIISVNAKITKEDLKGELVDFYRNNSSGWLKYITENVKAIITVGAALYSVNKSDDILPNHMYEIVFQKSYFYNPRVGKWIFPIDSFNEIFQPIPFEKNNRPLEIPVDTFKTNFAKYQLKQVISLDLFKPRIPKFSEIKIETTEEFIRLCSSIPNDAEVSYDLETSGFDPFLDRILCITISFEDYKGYFIPWRLVCKDNNKEVLNSLFKRVKNIGANLKFDCKFLRANGCPDSTVHDDII